MFASDGAHQQMDVCVVHVIDSTVLMAATCTYYIWVRFSVCAIRFAAVTGQNRFCTFHAQCRWERSGSCTFALSSVVLWFCFPWIFFAAHGFFGFGSCVIAVVIIFSQYSCFSLSNSCAYSLVSTIRIIHLQKFIYLASEKHKNVMQFHPLADRSAVCILCNVNMHQIYCRQTEFLLFVAMVSMHSVGFSACHANTRCSQDHQLSLTRANLNVSSRSVLNLLLDAQCCFHSNWIMGSFAQSFLNSDGRITES